jgi:hypothetical protein
MKVRPVRAGLYADGEMDTHDEATSRFSQFFEGAQKCTNQKATLNFLQTVFHKNADLQWSRTPPKRHFKIYAVQKVCVL